MSTRTVDERPPSDQARRDVALGLDHLVLVLAIAIAVPFTIPLCRPPTAYLAITFDNPTGLPLYIEVGTGSGNGWTPAGFVAPGSTVLVDSVVDEGDNWLFRFSSQDETGVELRVTWSELESSGWHIIVPAEVGERLTAPGRTASYPPSPRKATT